MAELLLLARDLMSADARVAPTRPKRGDVIAACPDGWAWSTIEKTHADWRILSIPALSREYAGVFEVGIEAAPGSGLLPCNRALGLDLGSSLWPADVAAALADDGRSTAIIPVAVPVGVMALLIVQRRAAADPNVIG